MRVFGAGIEKLAIDANVHAGPWSRRVMVVLLHLLALSACMACSQTGEFTMVKSALIRAATTLAAVLTLAVAMPGDVDAQLTFICSLGPGGAGAGALGMDGPPGPRGRAAFERVERALCGRARGCGAVSLGENDSAGVAVTFTDPRLSGARISYSPTAFNRIQAEYGPDAILGILAHELGHHIDFHSRPAWMDHAWGRELQADAWAGCALARLHVGTTALQGALRAIAAYPSPTHPGWDLRAPAVERGYVACGGGAFPGSRSPQLSDHGGAPPDDELACLDRCAEHRDVCADRCSTYDCEDRCDRRRDRCEELCDIRAGSGGDDSTSSERSGSRPAHWCCTPHGRFGPYHAADVPEGAACHWRTPFGLFYGRACN